MLSEIASIYRASKKKIDINWWTEWICRPPAAVVVYALRNTRITPNQITFASLVLCSGAGEWASASFSLTSSPGRAAASWICPP